MSNVTRRNFLQGLGGMVAICGLSACGGGSSEGGAASAALSPEEAEAAKAEVRRAIRLLFDRQYICDEIAQANQIPASTFVCQGVGEPDGSDFMANAGRGDGQGYYDVAQDALQANFDEAMEILKKYYTYDEASETFTDFPTMTYLYNTDEGHKAIGEYLQSTLAAIGITMNMENQEWATFLNTRKAGDYSIARNGWIMDYTDPISMLDMWTTESGNNDVQFGKGDHAALAMYNLDLTPFGYETKVENGTWADTFDVLIAAIKTEADQEKRFEMMHLA